MVEQETRLHWRRRDLEGRIRWVTEEEFHGEPDFVIMRAQGGLAQPGWECKMRSSRRPIWFETLDDAKEWAEAI